MGKLLKYAFAVFAIAVALAVYRNNGGDVEPEVMTEDGVWWGPTESDRNNTEIRPFRINISDQVIEDLRNRLTKVRSPVKPLENINFEYGFNSDHLTKIINYWSNNYNWTARQAYLNALPQFKTNIYGLDVHFIHVNPSISVSKKTFTVPLLLLHGWPGSVVEFYKIIPILTSQESDIVFEVIAPSLPGYGFSDASVKPGMGPAQMGQLFVKLMQRLGHEKFYMQGGDWGAVIIEAIAKIFPDRVYGMHSNICSTTTDLTLCDYTKLILGSFWPSLIVSSEIEKSATYPLSDLLFWFMEEFGYMHLQMTKPDTVGIALNDSPAGLAAYLLEKFSTWTNPRHKYLPDGGLSVYDLDELLDNVMVYWLSGSITTSMRLYSEFGTKKYQALPHIKSKVKVPVACAMFPHELRVGLSLKKLLKRKYLNLVSATEMQDGGHFAAFEQPQALANDIRSSILKMEIIRNNLS